MKQELIREMAERLNRSGPEIEKALTAFGSAVNDRLSAEGHAELAGLGRLVQEGRQRSFEPSAALSTAVNYRWEGVGQPLKESETLPSETQSPEAMSEEDPRPLRKASWAPLDEVDPTALSDTARQATEPSPVGRPPNSGDPERRNSGTGDSDAQSVEFDPVSPLVEDLTFETLHSTFADPTSETRGSIPVPPPATPARAAAEQRTASGSKSATKRPHGRGESGDRGSTNSRPVLIGVGALAVVAILVWIGIKVLGSEADPGSTGNTVIESTTPVEGGLAAGESGSETLSTEDSTAASETAGTDLTSTETDTPPPTPPPSTAAASDFDITASGYTLMVGSSTDIAGARTEMQSFSSLGHPVALLSYEDADGNLRHRIAVGQFASIARADSARQSMAGDLPSGTWVRRIRR